MRSVWQRDRGHARCWCNDTQKFSCESGCEASKEIENVILQHSEVAEVAVIGQPSEKWGESPLAIIVPKGGPMPKEEIIGHCKGKLAPFKIPKAVEFTDEIPRNPTGKILKRILREESPGPAPE